MNDLPEQERHVMPRVAVIGGGHWGKNLIRNFNALKSLAAICDRDEERLSTYKKQYPGCMIRSFTEILGDDSIPAVVVATPAETHNNFVKEALLAGKDVFVEKPLCLSVEDGERLVELARERKRVLMVGHLLWYHPAVLRLKELIDSGELGRIQYVYSNRLNLGKIRREENILWSFAPHDISVILGLLGEVPENVEAQGGNYLHPQIADVTVSLLSFASGIKAHIFVSWLHPFKEQKLIVVGDKKMAVFDDMEKENKLLLYPHSIEWKNQLPVPNKAEAQAVELPEGEPLRAECLHFLQSVETRRKPRTDGEEGLRVLKVLQQCQESLGGKAQPEARLKSVPENPSTHFFAHESAYIDEQVFVGKGTRIWHFTHILKGSSLGKGCKIGQNCVIGPRANVGNGVKIQNNVSIYEGVTLEDHVFCGPSMVFTNVFNPRSEIPRMEVLRKTLVKRGSTIGANATILCGITIGTYAFIGAGSVVLKDVPDYAVVVGNPARVTGSICRCGIKLVFSENKATCLDCGQSYKKEENIVQPVTNDQ